MWLILLSCTFKMVKIADIMFILNISKNDVINKQDILHTLNEYMINELHDN